MSRCLDASTHQADVERFQTYYHLLIAVQFDVGRLTLHEGNVPLTGILTDIQTPQSGVISTAVVCEGHVGTQALVSQPQVS